MKSATVKQIKDELKLRSEAELVELNLQLSKFKKENKELLTYLLFEAHDETEFIRGVKLEVEEQFVLINRNSYYLIKKSVRKILRSVKKYNRYSKKKETEVELLIHFCSCLKTMSPSMRANTVLINIFDRQLELITKSLSGLHEDLQHDYFSEIEALQQRE
jgi:hypothetical protein